MNELHFPAYIEVSQNRFRERFGLDFEDFQAGQKFKHRPGYTLTQQDNIDDCLDTLNQAMLHYDNHYADKTEFRKPLMVTTAIVQRLIGMTWKTFNRRKFIAKWSFINMISPVFAGDTLYAESEIISKSVESGDPECGLIVVQTKGINQDDRRVCEMEYEALVYKKASLPFSKYNY